MSPSSAVVWMLGLAAMLLGPAGCAQSLDAKRQAAKAAAPPTPSPAAGAAVAKSTGSPSGAPSLKLFNKTVIYVKDAYVDPGRIQPRRMLVAAVQAVAKVAPQLSVDATVPERLTLSSGETSRVFDISHVDSVWKMAFKFSEIYAEMVGALGLPDEARQLGFAASNGMLSTLDPFSMLLPEATFKGLAAAPGAAASPETLTASLLGPGVGYVRLRSLPGQSSRELALAIEDLRQRAGGTLRGAVLDLRGNTGGLLEQALRVTNAFVESGLIVTVTSLGGRQREEKRASKALMATDVPLVVLVGERTAAGAEVVAAALKDLDRALILGRRTGGFGTIQVLYEFGDTGGFGKAYLRLTIATMTRSSGTPLDGAGVVPDVLLVRGASQGEANAAGPSLTTGQLWGQLAALKSPRPESQERPAAELSYAWSEPPARTSLEAQLLDDVEVRLARDILLRGASRKRSEMLPAAQALVAEQRH